MSGLHTAMLKVKVRSFLVEMQGLLPAGWKVELRLFRADGEAWRINPQGSYRESGPESMPVDIVVSDVMEPGVQAAVAEETDG